MLVQSIRFLILLTGLALVAACGGGGGNPPPPPPALDAIDVVSVNSGGIIANNFNQGPDISADGRYVTFWSSADNLVANDTSGFVDVFLRDTQTNTTTRISVDSAGIEANGDSYANAISGDGRYVAFESAASNLAANDTNGTFDVFMRDTQTMTTTLISQDLTGVAANNSSAGAAISNDGRYVAFSSNATNLVANDSNTNTDSFVRDTQTGITSLVSVNSSGAQANSGSSNPAISADGRYVVFISAATNLVTGDTNVANDIFLRDRVAGITSRVSVASGGAQADASSYAPAISADGRYVAFYTRATNLVANDNNTDEDIFVHDSQNGITTRVSVASDGSEGDDISDSQPSLSADGRYVAFYSESTNLVANDTNMEADIFVHDRQTATTRRVSVAADGSEANRSSDGAAFSADGNYVVFYSPATTLVPAANNSVNHIFRAPNQ